jgi:hypothetical protein
MPVNHGAYILGPVPHTLINKALQNHPVDFVAGFPVANTPWPATAKTFHRSPKSSLIPEISQKRE